jgi:hypothetical protein
LGLGGIITLLSAAAPPAALCVRPNGFTEIFVSAELALMAFIVSCALFSRGWIRENSRWLIRILLNRDDPAAVGNTTSADGGAFAWFSSRGRRSSGGNKNL